jgi:hypothetical protein
MLIVAGADGSMWFSEPSGKIGRLTILGALTEYNVGANDLPIG